MVGIERVGGRATLGLVGELREIFRAALSVPPYDMAAAAVDGFAEELRSEADLAGFRCCLARADGSIRGFAYGAPAFLERPEDPWTEELVASVGPGVADEWIRGQFSFIWMAVLPAWQGRGMGGGLHDAVLAGVPEQRAWLVTFPFDCPAVHLYRRRGWLPIGHGPLGSGGSDRMIMGLELPR